MTERNIRLSAARVLVTGAAGFIGFHLVRRLLRAYPGIQVLGLDCLSDYYDVSLKEKRLSLLAEEFPRGWEFRRGDLRDAEGMQALFAEFCPEVVVNLAAQAGVRYSVTHPEEYIQTNVVGFFNVLECCRRYPVRHLVYASSSSIYGLNTKQPFAETDRTDSPVSLYGATKKSDELLAHAYCEEFGIPVTGLRFFTVYGPWGRPDMACCGFAEKMMAGEMLDIYNYGHCLRDFTYVDDITEGIELVMERAPEKRPGEREPACRIYNIGRSRPEKLMDFVHFLCEELKAAGALPADYSLEEHLRMVPPQTGDVAATYADVTALERATGFHPRTDLQEGLRSFCRWYAEWLRMKQAEVHHD